MSLPDFPINHIVFLRNCLLVYAAIMQFLCQYHWLGRVREEITWCTLLSSKNSCTPFILNTSSIMPHDIFSPSRLCFKTSFFNTPKYNPTHVCLLGALFPTTQVYCLLWKGVCSQNRNQDSQKSRSKAHLKAAQDLSLILWDQVSGLQLTEDSRGLPDCIIQYIKYSLTTRMEFCNHFEHFISIQGIQGVKEHIWFEYVFLLPKMTLPTKLKMF